MKYLAYLRVSDRHQVAGGGYDRQRDTIQRWLRCQPDDSLVVSNEIVDSHTGTDFDRPGLGNLLEIAEAGDVVLVERSDRLARDNLVAELILQEFRKLGVKVIDCEADIDLCHDDDPSKVLIRQMLQAIAQFEKSSIVAKLRKARDRKRARDGRCEGGKPFGHYPGEGYALDHILEGARHGLTASQIAQDMNAKIALGHVQLRPRKGARWNRGTVHKIIKANDLSIQG